jgi:hypothetical protein
MLTKLAYFYVLGLPFIAWLGIITLICLVFTASIPKMIKRGIKLPIKLHYVMAWVTIGLAVLHSILAIF